MLLPLLLAAETQQNPDLETIRASYNFQDPLKGASVPELIGRLISQALPFVGIIFLLLFIWSGIQWMTAGGDSAKVKHAIQTMKNAVIGMTIVVGAYFIVSVLLQTGVGILSSTGAPTR